MMRDVAISEASTPDLEDVLAVEREAFGRDEEAGLVLGLLEDPTARPLLSLLAREGGRPVGHVLFTAARLKEVPGAARCALLAPLAVVPDAQRRGVGGRLVEVGLDLLARSGVELVFVLGSSAYYPRHGFEPAGRHGLTAPYPIPPEHADAWMVRGLGEYEIGSDRGTVVCADALSKPEYWRE
jgi:putative acetyltransferase